MSNKNSRFASFLLEGKAQAIVLYGTSLSYHLSPPLRSALQAHFGEQATIVNSGMAGCASRTGISQIEQKVLAHKPDLVLMEFAINDAHDYHHEPEARDAGISPQESRENLLTLVSLIQDALPATEILLWTTNPTRDVQGSLMRGRSARPRLETYYQGVREVASARGLRVIEAERFWKSLQERLGAEFDALIPDGVHPNPKALREYFVPFLLDELGVPAQSS